MNGLFRRLFHPSGELDVVPAIPLTTVEAESVIESLTAADMLPWLTTGTYGGLPDGSAQARAAANELSRRVGVAQARGYRYVVVPVNQLAVYERALRVLMMLRPADPDLRPDPDTVLDFADLLSHMHQLAGTGQVLGWAADTTMPHTDFWAGAEPVRIDDNIDQTTAGTFGA